MPQILDAIAMKGYSLDHYYLVLDKMPHFVFERQGKRLVAEDDGFSRCYAYEAPGPTWKAFGGAEFDIQLKDGTVEHANGQWWDVSPMVTKDQGPLTPVGVATLESLSKCYVFTAANIATEKLNAWLAKNEPSRDYDKYRKQLSEPTNTGRTTQGE